MDADTLMYLHLERAAEEAQKKGDDSGSDDEYFSSLSEDSHLIARDEAAPVTGSGGEMLAPPELGELRRSVEKEKRERATAEKALDKSKRNSKEIVIEETATEGATTTEGHKGGWLSKVKHTFVSAGSSTVAAFSSAKSSIKYTFISKETEEALEHVNELLDMFFKDVPYGKVNMMMGLMLLNNYYSNKEHMITSGILANDIPFLELSERYMKFASGCFGWKLIFGLMYPNKAKGVMKGFAGGDPVNVLALCKHTGIKEEDLIVAKWNSTNFNPGHFIAVDHQTKAVVFAVRGTFHARDALTDLVAQNEPFMDGFAHTGMLRCATAKLAEVRIPLLETLQRFPEYRLIVTGHSLGAGVATVFTFLMHQEYPEIDMHCFAFAPPCSLSSNIAMGHLAKKLVDSYVLSDDIVPRLCWGSLEHLKSIIVQILGQSNNIFQRGFQIFSAGNTLGEKLTARVAHLLNCPPAPVVEYMRNLHMDTQMFPSGSVWHLQKMPGTGGFSKVRSQYVVEESNPSLFNEIIISSTMLTDHMPNKYEKAFSSCLKLLHEAYDGIDAPAPIEPTAPTTPTPTLAPTLVDAEHGLPLAIDTPPKENDVYTEGGSLVVEVQSLQVSDGAVLLDAKVSDQQTGITEEQIVVLNEPTPN